jgi:hypothetical protein
MLFWRKSCSGFSKTTNFYDFLYRLHPMSGIGAAFALMQRDRPVLQQAPPEVDPQDEVM